VGTLFIILFFGAVASGASQNNLEEFNRLQASLSEILDHPQGCLGDPETGQIRLPSQTGFFPWSSRSSFGSASPALPGPSSRPAREEILMDHVSSEAAVQDLTALNTVWERNLECDERQGVDGSNGTENSLNLKVVGGGSESDGVRPENGSRDDIEQRVDGILAGGGRDMASDQGTRLGSGPRRLGNYLNVEVHGITVRAINTVEGGSAVATSNIIIKPVQIIVYPSEVEERLR
jgi:hypothetical protein